MNNNIVSFSFDSDQNQLSFFFNIHICLDEIRRTLGEGTFGKVVEVRDLRG